MRVQHNANFRYVEMLDGIMLPGIQFLIYIAGQVFAKMNIITIAAETFPVIRNNFNGAFFYFFEDAGVA